MIIHARYEPQIITTSTNPPLEVSEQSKLKRKAANELTSTNKKIREKLQEKLEQALPPEVVEDMINPYHIPSMEHWKKEFKKVIGEVEEYGDDILYKLFFH